MFEMREVGLGVRKECEGRVVMKACMGRQLEVHS